MQASSDILQRKQAWRYHQDESGFGFIFTFSLSHDFFSPRDEIDEFFGVTGW